MTRYPVSHSARGFLRPRSHRVLVVAFAGLLLAVAAPAHTTGDLSVEYKTDPIGLDVVAPRFTWQLRADRRGVMQTAYQIQVVSDRPEFGGELLWDSRRVASDQSVQVAYAGPALVSGQRCYWRVRTWDEAGGPSAWSAPAFWEMGLLRPSDWRAEWITPASEQVAGKPNPPPIVRKEFRLEGPVRSARLYITSLGLYEAELNGRRVGDAALTPGWSSYNHRLQYQTYDVTELLQPGDNAIGVTLGDGWFRGPLTWDLKGDMYGGRLALLAQLHVTYADGHSAIVGTDQSWKTATGPILLSDIYAGERYDARLEQAGWSSAGYDDRTWAGVRSLDHSKSILVAPPAPPVRPIEEVKPIAILHTPTGETVVDFGQNMVGHVRLKVRGPAGTKVTLRHAEVLDRAGNFYTANLRGAAQKVEYTLKGGGEEVYEPHFTFQGFRYVAVAGYPGELTLDRLTGIVVHSDLPRTGQWESSNPLLNQLQHNIVWGQKGNFLGVPTDCPQRDERLGWTGDAQAFARTAAFNMQVAGFYTNWLRDLAADQRNGAVPFVIPDVLNRGKKEVETSSGWGDAATIVPWTTYLVYGDRRLLEAQYPSMKAWVEFMHARAKDDLWRTGSIFGDWLAYASSDSSYPGATTGKDLIATAFYAHSTDILARAAAALGKAEDTRTYAALFERIKAAFNREFVTPNGRVGEATQTAYVLALKFELLPENERAGAALRLAEDVHRFHDHLTTGFLGTPHLCRVLSDNGETATAYALLLQKTYPSWLYPVTQGATTIWERWDGQKPDGTFQDPGMNSFNHYAYGAIGDWMYSVVAGIDLDAAEPGYRHILVQPQPGGGLTFVRARLDTQYGEVASAWEFADHQFRLTVRVPPNTHATVRLPHAAKVSAVTEGDQPLAKAAGVRKATADGDAVVVEVGSGDYHFAYPTNGGDETF